MPAGTRACTSCTQRQAETATVEDMMRVPFCSICGEKAQFQCRGTSELLCLEHASLEVTTRSQRCGGNATLDAAGPQDYARIAALAYHFWDETEVYCFGKTYDITSLPAYVARVNTETVGAISYAVERGRMVIVLLNVLPGFQGLGLGRGLIEATVEKATRQGLTRVVVATSNDDLPALYFYQRNGFTIADIRPGEVLRHHGGEVVGFAGIPVRDEIRLERFINTEADN